MKHSLKSVDCKLVSAVLAVFLIPTSLFLLPLAADAATIGRPSNNLGLVGYWDFDTGKFSDTVYDRSGKGNDGTLTNMDAAEDWVHGKVGTALEFDGDNDFVDVSTGGPTLSAITVSVWFKINAFDISWQTLVGKGEFASWRLARNGTNNRLEFSGLSSNWIVSPGTVNIIDGEWHHAVATHEGTTLRLYIDGVLDKEGSATAPTTQSLGPFYIGNNPDEAARYWEGLVDDVRIYNRVISKGEIRRLYNQGVSGHGVRASKGIDNNGLVGYWSFEEGAGTEAGDFSGNNNHGTLQTMTEEDWVSGIRGTALEFDGSSDHIVLGQPSHLNFTPNIDEFTISAWIKVETGNDGTIVGKGPSTSGSRQYQMFANSDTHLQGVVGGTAIDSEVAVVDGEWHHVVGRNYNDGGTLRFRFYIDGVEDDTTIVSGATTNTCDVLIGSRRDTCNTGTGFRYDGIIDDVRIYNRALSGAEIVNLYNASGPTRVSTSFAHRITNGLVGHWTFDGDVTGASYTADVSGNNNTGTFNGGMNQSSAVIGRLGQALTFDGSDDYVTHAASFPNAAGTIAQWVRPDQIRNMVIGPYFSDGTTATTYNGFANGGVHLEVHPGILSSAFSATFQDGNGDVANAAGRWEVSGGTPVIGTWSHAVMTWDTGGSLVLYVDGESVSSVDMSGGTFSGLAATVSQIGRVGDGTASRHWDGTIDDARIYNRALTAKEVEQLYNMGR